MINQSKTQIMHFRKKGTVRSLQNFSFGTLSLDYTEAYKYLGFTLDEFMSYDSGIAILADSAGRAVGSIISKMKFCKDIGYSTYSQLYDACVCPILVYAAGVWGFKDVKQVNSIQNRAIRCFLGVHAFAPSLAIQGDMGWEPMEIRQKGEVIRLWNRLVNMSESRLTKKVFNWDKAHNGPWTKGVFSILREADLAYVFLNMLCCNINLLKQKIFCNHKEKWSNDIWSKPKLRSYVQIKHCFGTEPYVKSFLTRNQRSLCAQLRAGILPLAIEVGRFSAVPEENRICNVCDLKDVENEFHFMFYCTLYDDLRVPLFDVMQKRKPELFWEDDGQKLEWLFNYEVFKTAHFVSKAWSRRQSQLFK